MYLSRCEKPSGYNIFKVHKRKGVFTQESLFRKVCLDRWMTTVSETAVLLLCEGSLTLVLFVSRKLLESSEWGIRRVCVGGISSPVAGTVTAVEITFCLNHFCTLFSLNSLSLLRKPCDWVLIIRHQHDIKSFLAPTWLQCFHRASYFLVLQHSFKKGTSWEYLMFVSLFAFQHFTKSLFSGNWTVLLAFPHHYPIFCYVSYKMQHPCFCLTVESTDEQVGVCGPAVGRDGTVDSGKPCKHNCDPLS